MSLLCALSVSWQSTEFVICWSASGIAVYPFFMRHFNMQEVDRLEAGRTETFIRADRSQILLEQHPIQFLFLVSPSPCFYSIWTVQFPSAPTFLECRLQRMLYRSNTTIGAPSRRWLPPSTKSPTYCHLIPTRIERNSAHPSTSGTLPDST